ncbi:MAG TPA: adenine phosphoribosyltransferase [Gemmatimonadaceae bacterium]|nr:adenine phosphoribosyltransferase [Gemmatimonadaceae bacterium]
MSLATDVAGAIRDVPDFPKPGILFKDITPVLLDPALFRRVTDALAAPFSGDAITHVVAVESRGFILGAPVALRLAAGLVPVRKPGKLPAARERVEYQLEYGTDALEMHADALPTGARVLVVDDVLATGGTAAAACRLVEQVGARVIGLSFLMALGFLDGAAELKGRRVETIVTV